MQASVDQMGSINSAMPLAMKAFEDGLSAHDANYLRLAKKLACALATLDKDLRRAAKNSGVPIAGDLAP
jgi:predicted nucleic acid-binding protein